MSKYLVQEDPRHIRHTGIAFVVVLPSLALFLITNLVTPGKLIDHAAFFYAPLTALYWVGVFGGIPLLILCATVWIAIWRDASQRFIVSARIWLMRYIYLVAYLLVLWFLLVGGLWLSLLAFWGRY
jgi:hypothetical protein